MKVVRGLYVYYMYTICILYVMYTICILIASLFMCYFGRIGHNSQNFVIIYHCILFTVIFEFQTNIFGCKNPISSMTPITLFIMITRLYHFLTTMILTIPASDHTFLLMINQFWMVNRLYLITFLTLIKVGTVFIQRKVNCTYVH